MWRRDRVRGGRSPGRVHRRGALAAAGLAALVVAAAMLAPGALDLGPSTPARPGTTATEHGGGLPDVELAAAQATATPSKPARPARPAKPANPKDLGALQRLMASAVQAKGSVHVDHAFVVTDGYVSRRDIGSIAWVKGVPTYDVNELGRYVSTRRIGLPGEVYERSLKSWSDEGWFHYRAQDLDSQERAYLTVLGRQFNPALRYPGLSRLKVTRGTPRVIDGVTCWPYVVRMTLRQNMATLPREMQWDPKAVASATTVTTFFVDARGLPHKVVEASRDGHSRFNDVTTYTRWGVKVTVTAPTGPVTEARDLTPI